MKTGVCFIIFRRAAHTRRVFEVIRAAKPPFLYVAGDGPRPWKPEDYAMVEAARAEIKVDWDCEAIFDLAPENMGCGWRMATAVTRAFEHVDELVMLEDDTLPAISYFQMVDELLEMYREHKHIWCISGARASRVQMKPDDYSYEFTHSVWTCSLATWKDRFAHYDFFARYWQDEAYRKPLYDRLKDDPNELAIWVRAMNDAFIRSHQPYYETFDFQYQYFVKAFGYGIVANQNLVSNIGFDSMGTNATDPASPVANLPAYGMDFPLRHPPMPEPLPWGLPEHA